MGALTDHLENALINHVLRNTAYTSPATIRLALFTTAPGETGGGTEVSGGGYARQPVTFGAPAAGTTTNSAEVIFPVATADWGTTEITHFAIFDAVTAGNMLIFGGFTLARRILSGDQLVIRVGQLSITFN